MEIVLAQPVSRQRVIWSHCLVTTLGSLLLCLTVWVAIWAGIQTNETTKTVRAPFLSTPGFSIPNPWGEELEIVTPMRQQLDAEDLLVGSVNLFCLTFFIAGFATWMSAWDRYRWRTIGISLGFLILQSVLLYIAMALPAWSWLGWLTVFSAYIPEQLIAAAAEQSGGAWQWLRYDAAGQWDGLGGAGANLLLMFLGTTCYLLSVRTFLRRDLPSPL